MFGNNLVFPFMDMELFRFLQELPVSLKCKGDSVLDIARGRSVSKYLLKYHYKPLLPEAITSKKKQGGFAPMPLFFRDKARRARFKEFILSSGIMGDYLRRDAVEKFLADYEQVADQAGGWFWYRQNKALQYFNLLTLVVWWEEFVATGGHVIEPGNQLTQGGFATAGGAYNGHRLPGLHMKVHIVKHCQVPVVGESIFTRIHTIIFSVIS